ncbi:MAG: pseudaminic acid synthase [Candidatus Zixiibacteriota bacterium]
MSGKSITIEKRLIGPDHPPYIIAEMSGNHNQSLEQALKIVEAAAGSGAHAIKLQTYTADTMTLDINEREFRIDDPASLWDGYSLYQLYDRAHTPWGWHRPIFERCRELGITVFSTPFDVTAVDFLEELNAPAYKVASFENADIALIKRIAATGKPMIISTGMATIAELDESVRVARNAGCDDIVLLKCTSSYPASPDGCNIQTIPHLAELFDVQAGLSDHTLGVGVALASVALGSTVIEKHFILDRNDGGVDAAFSMEPQEMSILVQESKRAWQSLGKVAYGTTTQESGSLQFRRSLYVVEDVRRGQELTKRNLRAIRPGHGLSPRHIDSLLGRKVRHDVARGTAATWDIVS